MLFQADHIAWRTPAGRRLDEFARVLPRAPRLEVNVFGSAPLRLFIEPPFTSAEREYQDFAPTRKERLGRIGKM